MLINSTAISVHYMNSTYSSECCVTLQNDTVGTETDHFNNASLCNYIEQKKYVILLYIKYVHYSLLILCKKLQAEYVKRKFLMTLSNESG